LHFVVVGQSDDIETLRAIPEQKPKFEVRPALESLCPKFPNAQPGMLVRLAKRFPQVVQCQQAFRVFGPG
jgi:hypothetical protein